MENFRPLIYFRLFETKTECFRNIVSCQLLGDIFNLSINAKVKSSLYLKNSINDSEIGPISIEFSDIRDPTLQKDSFPKLLTSDWTGNDDLILRNSKYPGVIFLDYSFLLTLRDRHANPFHLLQFRLAFEGVEGFLNDFKSF